MKIILSAVLLILLIPAFIVAEWSNISLREMQDLNEDLDAYMASAKVSLKNADRHYISQLAVQNIYKQNAIWRSALQQNEMINDILSESLVKFIFIHYYLENPNWTDWGLWQLETFYPSYSAYIDTSTDMSYGQCLSFVKNNWLPTFAKCNSFNELIPAKKLEDNPISLIVRQGVLSDEDRYVLDCAVNFINHGMSEHREWFTFYVAEGEYQVGDEKGFVFPKEFDASPDSMQFIYFTPNYSFDFVPVAKVYSDAGFSYDTLSSTDFELIRINEGRIAVFDSLEFGRYLFKVKPPYKIVDKFPNKLIIPKEAFGADYMDKESAMFNKHAYDRITVGNRQKLIYTKIERVETPDLVNMEKEP